ncbi:MAG: hypothetical protein H8E85_07185 [Candidatus Marinimicrobia bacterium]|nr:hypothetical protein [Candidatus Neomarinimicrobiota bacterium]
MMEGTEIEIGHLLLVIRHLSIVTWRGKGQGIIGMVDGWKIENKNWV